MMSNNIKILLVVLIPLLIFAFLYFRGKGSSSSESNNTGEGEDETPKPAPCIQLGRVEYLEEKRIRRDQVERDVTAHIYPVGVVEMIEKYRVAALAAGKQNTNHDIREYAFWAEADLKMQEDGYCYLKV